MSHSFGASNYRHSHPRAKSRSERQPQQAAPPSRFEFDEDHLEEKGRPKSSSAAVRTRSMPLHQRTQTHVLFDEMIHSARRIVSVPSDREKVRTTTRIVNLASDYLNRKKAASGALITEQNLPYSPQLKAIPREHLSYLVRQRENGAWQATVSIFCPSSSTAQESPSPHHYFIYSFLPCYRSPWLSPMYEVIIQIRKELDQVTSPLASMLLKKEHWQQPVTMLPLYGPSLAKEAAAQSVVTRSNRIRALLIVEIVVNWSVPNAPRLVGRVACFLPRTITMKALSEYVISVSN